MSKVYKIAKRIVTTALIGVVLSNAPIASASTNVDIEANKAIVRNVLEQKGTAGYQLVADAAFASEHKQIRAEFENLLFNADDPVLSAASDVDTIAITQRNNTVTRLLGEANTVAATVRIKGIHSGNLYGIPATNKSFEIDAGAIFKFANGKIVESWYMADEAALLRQLGVRLPARQDGKLNLPPVYDDVRTYDEALSEHLADPKDTPEYQHTRLLLSYKSKAENRPADYTFTGRPYSNLVRGGIDTIVARAAELNVEGSHPQSMSDRRDMVGTVVSDGDLSMMSFRLTALNSGPLYGIPASGHRLHDWELGFARFEGDKWVDAWWMADELGFLLTIGSPEALNFLVGE